jgi:hypothetical protein
MICFFSGVICQSGIIMMRQDMMGLEKYKVYIDLMWTELHPIWGFGLILVGALMFGYALKQGEKDAS